MANNSNQPLTADNLEAHDQNLEDEDGTDNQRRAQRGTARRGSIDLQPDTKNHMNDESHLEYINSPDRYWNIHKRTGSGSSMASSLNSIECDESEDLEVNTTVTTGTTDNRSRKSDDDSDHSEVDESFDNDKSTKNELGRRESVGILPPNADHDEPEEDDDNSIQHPTDITKTSSSSSPGENEGELGDDTTAQPTVSNTAQNNWPKPLVMIVMMMIIIYGLFVKYQQMISHVQHIEAEKANIPYTDNTKLSKMSEIDEYFCDAVFNGSGNVYNYLMEDDNVWQYE